LPPLERVRPETDRTAPALTSFLRCLLYPPIRFEGGSTPGFGSDPALLPMLAPFKYDAALRSPGSNIIKLSLEGAKNSSNYGITATSKSFA